MTRIILFSALFARKYKNRIVGGNDVSISKNGWQVSVQSNKQHFCGGSIIAKDWVLTSSQCVVDKQSPPKDLTVRVGTSTHNDGGQVYDVVEIIKHPKYNKAVPDDFDVALLRIKGPISFTPCTVTPVKLIQSGKEVPKGATLSVTGWGATKEWGPISPKLQEVKVKAYSSQECKNSHAINNDIISDSMMCAGFPQGQKDTCHGDSGGPLVDEKRVQVGVISWRRGCARPGNPGVYAKLSHPEIQKFIKKYVNK
ncbi:trypsin-7-like [Ctenocephalides felis]|uniref:trypsin-7-like n=1 Tax=Ctenocephalides felis TaxID=7515 RepID=UPI000E6E11CD|nr:trypsin-7-like [Ctenocephalides felis]